MRTIRRKWLVTAWIALVVTGVVSNVMTVRQLQMEAAPLSPRYTDYAFPAAISAMRGLTDYTAYAEIAAVFIHHKDRAIADNISIATSVAIKDPEIRWFISGDDKGLIDLVETSLRLFGASVTSVYLLIGALCLVSIVTYSMAFYRSGPKMALLVATLGGFHAVLFTFGLTDQSASIIEPRFLGFIGIVPLLHVLMTLAEKGERGFWPLVLATVQVSIVMLVVHLRGSEVWQLLCILAFFILALVVRKGRSRAGIAIATAVLVTGGALTTYRHATYHQRYLTTDVTSRVFWHNAVMGLAANSVIRQRFKIQMLYDPSITEAVKQYLTVTGQKNLRDIIFSDINYAEGSFQNFNWSLYEPVAREFYFHILYAMPIETLKTYFLIMPNMYIASLSFMTGGAFPQAYHVVSEVAEPPSQRRLHDHYLKPLRILPVVLILASTLLLAAGVRVIDWPAVAAIVTAIVGSSIPPLLAMPVIQYNQLFTMLIFSGTYFSAMMILAVALRQAYKFAPFALH